jgi:hypothetical protein
MPRPVSQVLGAACAVAVLIGPVVAISPVSARADDAPGVAQRDAPKPVLVTREVLEDIETGGRLAEEPSWISSHFRIAGKGVKFSHPLSLAERQLVLNVTGPLLRRGLGLSFEVRF